MKKLLPLVLIAACTSGPSKEESVQIWAAASTAMASAQQRAVDSARSGAVRPVTDLTLDWSGACTLGGSVGVKGSYEGNSSDDHASFDLRTTFTGCRELQGSIDGDIHWASTATGSDFSATMEGNVDWHGQDGSASCDFNLALHLSSTSVSYGGQLCGYAVGSELHLGP